MNEENNIKKKKKPSFLTMIFAAAVTAVMYISLKLF